MKYARLTAGVFFLPRIDTNVHEKIQATDLVLYSFVSIRVF
jgi:hypothetical protein